MKIIITSKVRSPKCKAQGCNRRTKSPTGFCWQHWDMAKYQKEATLEAQKVQP